MGLLQGTKQKGEKHVCSLLGAPVWALLKGAVGRSAAGAQGFPPPAC